MSTKLRGFMTGVGIGLLILAILFFYKGRNGVRPISTAPTAPSAIDAEQSSAKISDAKVKLAVLVVFDQMRGDYIDRWMELYGQNGFRRMKQEGAHFTNCYYPYGITTTGPGHASMLTGTSPNKHGITNNKWFNRNTANGAYCAASERYEFLPYREKKAAKLPGAPEPLLSPTVGDVLKLATDGKGKVFGVSLKDRGAILPTGHKADGAYWFDGEFVTSTFYRDSLPDWVKDFNRSKVMDQWFEKQWTKLRPDIDYKQYSGIDDAPGEGRTSGRGIEFPHSLAGEKNKIGPEYYASIVCSPYGNQLVLDFAKQCIENEKLGQGSVPDLLTISFSSNDIVGHAYGPNSQEVLDITLRSDLIMADLLSYLDDKIGKGNYSLALTADHGVCDVPELKAAIGFDAKRVMEVSLLKEAEEALQAQFGKLPGSFETIESMKKATWIETIEEPWLYFNERLCASKGVKVADLAKAYAAVLKKHPDVAKVYTAEDLANPEQLDEQGKLMAKSFYPNRSGDVAILLKEGYLFIEKQTQLGTSHGTPYDYDRYVPLIIMGPNVLPGDKTEAVVPQHSASILSYFLGISPPKDNDYTLPKSLLKP